jgi:hypothetical protein
VLFHQDFFNKKLTKIIGKNDEKRSAEKKEIATIIATNIKIKGFRLNKQ